MIDLPPEWEFPTYDFLGLTGITTTSVAHGEDQIVVEAETAAPVFPKCCLLQDLVRDGFRAKRRLINDTPHGGLPLAIMFLVRRAKCRGCGKKGIDETLPHIHPQRHMTNRLYKYIAKEGLRKTNASVARTLHVSEGTARSIIKGVIETQVDKRKIKTPRVLGLDEKTMLRKFRAVLGNVEERTLIDILPDRDGSLDDWLRDLPNKKAVEVLCIDMFTGYLRAARRFLPGVAVVADKFHVVRRANVAMDKVRIAVARDQTGQDRANLKRAKKIFSMRARDLEGEAEEKVRRWCQRFPELGAAYWAKERYYQMYEQDFTPAQAEAYFKAWMSNLRPEIAPIFKMNCGIQPIWRPAVFGYFEHRFTSGYVEAVNRVIDDIHRAGRGYSFEVIRGKLLLSPELQKKTFRRRTSKPSRDDGISYSRGMGSSGGVNARLGASLDAIARELAMGNIFPDVIEFEPIYL